jgi:hypothetical protein
LAVQLVDQRHVIPWGSAEVRLECLAVEVVAVGDRLGILVFEVGEQSGEVGAGRLPALGAGQRGDERLGEGLQALDGAAEGGGWDLAVGQQLGLALLEPGLHHQTPSIEVMLSLEGIDTNGGYVRSSDPRQ